MGCPVCGSERLRHLGYAAPSRRAGYSCHEIVECRRCGLSFSDPTPSAETLAVFYSSAGAYMDEYGSQDFGWQRMQHEKDLRRVAVRKPPPGRLLDVGSSYGLLLEVAQSLGWGLSA